ncbi:TolC family protein [Phenylobacterium aquaticum]|uniref:TolC family protein n=1 Tax=Phenylobacterium aquaticum TaxID=1763816 RepID=UPI001F5E12FF|nr:TolC family protein [Phenylobacterium aquaticum]MCI3130910.1 TolC family protein [Phenylobacterium aquaticum]
MRLPIALASLLVASGAQAAPLTYAAALDAAQRTSPSLQARALQIESARTAARAAGALPDPKIAFGLDNFPVSGPPAGRFNKESMTMARVGIMQDMPNGAKRAAERTRAQTDIQAAGTAAQVGARDVRTATALAWINLYYAERRLSAIDELAKSLDPLWNSAPSTVASGAARPAQSLEVEQMRADLQDRRSEILAAVGRARADLVRWTGDPQADVAGSPPRFEVDATALRAGLTGHPRLAERAAMTAQAQAEVRFARAQKRPDWSWELAYQRRDPMFGDMISAGVTVTLPLFAARRQDPIIAAKLAAAAESRAEAEATRRELAAQLEAGLADYLMRHDQWSRAKDVLLPLAKRRADLETASYGAGRGGLTDVLQAFTALANAQLTLLDREAAVAADAATLVLTYASDRP